MWVRLEYHLLSGIALPETICESCYTEIVSFFLKWEDLPQLLARGLHACTHQITAITLLHACLNGPTELIAQLGVELAQHGWDPHPEIGGGWGGPVN
ncbi:hypothetical protein B5P43_15585 [Bacillus sp. SRB_336]|nr:hypothetical protein B5P43_15585 [Bacillus sp. SRB_336]